MLSTEHNRLFWMTESLFIKPKTSQVDKLSSWLLWNVYESLFSLCYRIEMCLNISFMSVTFFFYQNHCHTMWAISSVYCMVTGVYCSYNLMCTHPYHQLIFNWVILSAYFKNFKNVNQVHVFYYENICSGNKVIVSWYNTVWCVRMLIHVLSCIYD